MRLQRLKKLQVLLDPSVVPPSSKVFSTRFVKTWREKHNDKEIQIRCKRVCWVGPASGIRTLPTIFLEQRERRNMVLASLDVHDGFLTVAAERPTLVHTADAQGVVRSYALGKVLPGQYDGSLLWYRAITNFLKTELDLVDPCGARTLSLHLEVERWCLCCDDSC